MTSDCGSFGVGDFRDERQFSGDSVIPAQPRDGASMTLMRHSFLP
jgi:hypothetical protein